MKRFSPALIVSVVAVVLALTGTAVAGNLINGKNIKSGTVTGKQVKDRSLTAQDFKGSVQGPQGPQGVSGSQGPAGPTGIASIVTGQADDYGVAFAYCPAGTRPVSGGGYNDSGYPMLASGAASDANGVGWLVAGYNASDHVVAFAYCSSGVSSFTFANGQVRSRSTALTVQKAKALLKP